jgi:hypothetical protein
MGSTKSSISSLLTASFIAKRDNPGFCPGDGWQLLSRQAGMAAAVKLAKEVFPEKRASAANTAQQLFRSNSMANAIVSARS